MVVAPEEEEKFGAVNVVPEEKLDVPEEKFGVVNVVPEVRGKSRHSKEAITIHQRVSRDWPECLDASVLEIGSADSFRLNPFPFFRSIQSKGLECFAHRSLSKA